MGNFKTNVRLERNNELPCTQPLASISLTSWPTVLYIPVTPPQLTYSEATPRHYVISSVNVLVHDF